MKKILLLFIIILNFQSFAQCPTVDIGPPSALFCTSQPLQLTATNNPLIASDFVGMFTPSNWILSNNNANYVHTVNFNPNLTSFTLYQGTNIAQNQSVISKILNTPNTAVTVSFDWTFSQNYGGDGEVSHCNVIANGATTQLDNFTGSTTISPRSGSMTINLVAGQQFGFNISNDVNYATNSNLIISNFKVTAPIVYDVWTATNGGFIVGSPNQTTVNFTSSGTYTYTGYTSNAVCTVTDSIDVTINASNTQTQNIDACASYTWSQNGQTYTNSGTYSYLENCTNYILNLNITPQTTNDTTLLVCLSYTWPINNQTYTTSGTYTAVVGCVTNVLTLVINNVIPPTPTAQDVQTFNISSNATVSDLVAVGLNGQNGINWYNSPTSTIILPTTQLLTNGTIYYASVINNKCESLRKAVTVTINNLTVDVGASQVTNCENSVQSLNAVITDSYSVNVTGFTGLYQPSNWTLTNTNTNGNVNHPDANTLVFTGGNSGTNSTENSYYTITPPVVSTISFSYTFNNIPDAISDKPYIKIGNNNPILLSGFSQFGSGNQSGTMTLSVDAGATFSFIMFTLNNNSSAPGAILTITDFTVTPSAVPITSTVWTTYNGGTISGSTTSVSAIPLTSGTYTFTAINGLGFSATDSVDLTISPAVANTTDITSCDSYTWANTGQTYTQSGTYTGTTTNCVTEKLNLTITPITYNTTILTACDSYVWNNQTYTQSGTYFGLTTNCVTEKLILSVNQGTSTTITANACGSYYWSETDDTYTSSGNYSTLNGCETRTLNLTITPSTENTTSIAECNNYYWANINTTYTQSGIYTGSTTNCVTEKLNLTILPLTQSVITITECETFTWANTGQTYTQSGIYTGLTSNCNTEMLDLTITGTSGTTFFVNGCDSYTWAINGQTYSQTGFYPYLHTPGNGCTDYYLNLTMNNTPTITGNSTQSIPSTGTVGDIVVLPSNVVWYLTEADALSSSNAILNSFPITTSSTYYAVANNGTCASTPFLVNVNLLSNQDFDTTNFSFYPNPTNVIVNIKYSKEISHITVTNLLGQQLVDKEFNSSEVQIDLSSFPTSAYFIKVIADGKEKVFKVIKE